MSRSQRRGCLAALSLALLVLVACSTDPSPPETESIIASGLDAPWSVVFVGDSVLIGERDSARVLELVDGGEPREVATIPGVVAQGEGGLLGLAVQGDEYLYAYSTAASENRIQRFPLTGAPGSLSLGPAQTVIDGLPSGTNHNGGRIAFGPDGMLYATVGDAGQPERAPSLDSLGGKILRVTPDGAIPDDNPFPGSPVYSYGHRNPQGIGWDGEGTFYASEFGQNTWDELNVIVAGANYGWPEVEGIAGEGRFTDPVQQWEPSVASPSGIAVDADTIYIANLRGETLRTVPLSDLTASTEHLTGELGRLRDVVVTPEGALWVLTNNTDGRGEPRTDDDRLVDVTSVIQ